MSKILMVPLHLDALFLPHDQSVLEPFADFSLLPYFDGQRDLNPNRAHLSEEILSQPLENPNLILKAGVHLHWALPDALTKGVRESGGISFPAVPNRWLVIRSLKSQITRWVVESDYLYSPDTEAPATAISYPYNDETHPQPFRYLGRKLPLAAWLNQDRSSAQSGRYLDKLTAAGYGEPNFAAFYPNCHSVFGFHDDDFGANQKPEGVAYVIIGWYDDPGQDAIRKFLDDFAPNTIVDSSAKWHQALEQSFAWTTTPDQSLPEAMICYAQLTFKATEFDNETPGDAQVTVAIGNTGTEALSAYLAQNLPGDSRIIEEQIEALYLASHLESRRLDLDAKFQEARHEKGFTAVPGGTLWTIRAERSDLTAEHDTAASNQSQATLPEMLAHPLNRLNEAQQRYDRARHEIESLREQLFADWYKFMLCAYPPEDSTDEYPDLDEVKYFIERSSMAPLEWKIADTGTLVLRENDLGEIAEAAAWTVLFRLELSLRPELENLSVEELRPAFEQAGFPLAANANVTALGRQWLVQSGTQRFTIREEANGLSVYREQSAAAITLASRLAAAINAGLAAAAQAQKLAKTDIKDWQAFQQQLKLHQSAPLQRLWQRLSSASQNALSGNEISAAQQAQIIDDLNRILADATLYDAGTFAGLTLPGEAKRLLQQRANWSEKETLRCNRLLFEAMLGEIVIPAPRYVLRQQAAPRFWRPNEPVILLVDENLKPTPRHGEDGRLHPEGLLECQILSLPTDRIPQNYEMIRAAIANLTPVAGEERIGFSDWTSQPWHPYLLEWAVEVYPVSSALFQTELQYAEALDRGEIASGLKNEFQQNGISLSANCAVSFTVAGQYWEISDRDRNDNPRTYIIEREDDELGVYAHPADAITCNYELSENVVDLTLQPGRGRLFKAANTYAGRSILTPQSKDLLQQALEEFLEKQLLPDYYAAQHIDESLRTNNYFDTHRASILAWYRAKAPAQRDPVIDFMLTVDDLLARPNFNPLSQSLNGFNDALLMHKRTLQLPIADPIGFEEYRAFSDSVRALVQNQNRRAPQPLNDFNPVRYGFMRLLELRLVDTFGRIQNLSFDSVLTTEVMQAAAHPYLVALPPRLVQPARLNFRWLAASTAATGDEAEMNDHPASTPVCGWLVPNNLDGSVMVFDGEGRALGSINRLCQWTPAPGPQRLLSWDLPNPHLKQMVNHLLVQGPNYLSHFLIAIDQALENIDPESFAQHESLTLLMGRPIAIVRASLDLELKGLPAINQDWNVFRHDMERNNNAKIDFEKQATIRETGDLENTRFPIRLGEYRQLNDGLVGFWQEAWADDGTYDYANDRFYINDSLAALTTAAYTNDPQLSRVNMDATQKQIVLKILQSAGGPIKKQQFLGRLEEGEAIWQRLIELGMLEPQAVPPNLIYYADAPDLMQAIAAPGHKLTLLIDPRGVVHATCGILPTKSIHLPREQFAEALRNIEITFLTAPILTQNDQIKLPLPEEPGMEWSWVEKENGAWGESAEIRAADTQASFAGKTMIKEGWLKLKRR